MSDYAGLRAIVTGGASGIGAAIVAAFVREGVKVALLDRDPGGPIDGVLALQVDVTDASAVHEAVDEAARQLGGLDIVVNNAGIGAQGDVAANADDEWLHVLNVNVVGIARVSRAALPHLRKSDHAAIVNTGSIVATTGLPNRALYSASKGAVISLTRAMAADHLADGIRVNCVSPGTADTPWIERLLAVADDPEAARAALAARQPHGRLVSASEIADAVLYLASPRSGSTNGHVLAVDGGLGAIQVPRA